MRRVGQAAGIAAKLPGVLRADASIHRPIGIVTVTNTAAVNASNALNRLFASFSHTVRSATLILLAMVGTGLTLARLQSGRPAIGVALGFGTPWSAVYREQRVANSTVVPWPG